MVLTGTNADDANTSGAMIGKDAACVVSGSFSASPTSENTHESAYAQKRTSSSAQKNMAQFVCILNPTAKPTPEISMITRILRIRSAVVRPVRTPDRAMGSERNRSRTPLCTSVAMLMPVVIAPKVTVWAKMPGIR